jgi:hypothetical protein
LKIGEDPEIFFVLLVVFWPPLPLPSVEKGILPQILGSFRLPNIGRDVEGV